MKAYLILENGTVFTGEQFGAVTEEAGELVFSTTMGSYVEAITDPAYYGQILVQTYPLIGNYGMIKADMESGKAHLKGYIVRQMCDAPANFRCEGLLQDFLTEQGIMGISGIDTRQITKILREEGTMKAVITTKDPREVCFDYDIKDAVAKVSTKEKYTLGEGGKNVAILDLGVLKSAILPFTSRGARVTVLPYNTSSQELLSYDALYISDGPGNPEDYSDIAKTLGEVFGKLPIFATGLGHQILAMSQGAKTTKLHYGHRGANQPVRRLDNGRVYITMQNHGYAVVKETLPDFATVTFENVNDRSCEGIFYNDKNALSLQFRPCEGNGPNETGFAFDKFFEMIGGSVNA